MNNWYGISKMASAVKERDYGWVSLALPKDIAKKTVSFSKSIPERELYIEKSDEGETIHGDGWKYGIEDDPHITVLWGIHTKVVKNIINALKDQKGGSASLGQIGMFEAEDYDVLKVNIISPALHRLNGILQENVKHSSTHPQYHPHITLAYLKCGNGAKYIKDKRFKNLKFNFDSVIFEDYEDKSTTLDLPC